MPGKVVASTYPSNPYRGLMPDPAELKFEVINSVFDNFSYERRALNFSS